MKTAPLPANEEQRLHALQRYKVLDTGFDKVYDELPQLAACICQTPIALISLIDSDRQWFKAKVGLEARETPRDVAFCAHAIHGHDIFEVPDATIDERFADNPLVTGNPHVRFYLGAPLTTPEGFNIGTLCVIDHEPRQLTEDQKQALRVLARQVVTQLELHLALEQLQRYVQQLQDANATREKLFSIISHDLRSPLNAILGVTEMLLDESMEDNPEERREMMTDLNEATHNTLDLLDNLLQWARMQRGQLPFTPTPLVLTDVLRKVTGLLNPAFTQKKIALGVQCPADLWVRADANMLYSVIQNLLSNSLKFTRPHGAINIIVTIVEQMASVTVADNGLGMPPEKVAKLFTIDSNISTTGTAGERGTGLGLVLTRQLVEKNGGTIAVSSTQNVGTQITFTLPLISSTELED